MKEINKIFFENEIDLKKYLAAKNYFYGELGMQYQYVVAYRDNRAGTLLARGVYASPILALRNLNNIVPEVKLPINEIDVQLELAFHPLQEIKPYQFEDYVTISPYIYFKKSDEKKSEDTQTLDNKQ